MTLDVLLSAMHLRDYSYIDTLNITGNCVIINQCEIENRQVIIDNGRNIVYIETPERGLSKSRNMAIEHSKADVCIFCDNDVEYQEEYEQLILEEYEYSEGQGTTQGRHPTGRSIRKRVGYVAHTTDFDWLNRPDVKADFEDYGAQIISLLDEDR